MLLLWILLSYTILISIYKWINAKDGLATWYIGLLIKNKHLPYWIELPCDEYLQMDQY